MVEITGLASQAAGEDPAEGLAAVAELRELVSALEEAHVRQARERGWSWQDIADALGVSRQTVHKKYVVRRWRRDE
jgi:DNA-directed RNA polymerase specialized sigma24 family protein